MKKLIKNTLRTMLLLHCAMTFALTEDNYVSISLITSQTQVVAGQTITVGVVQDITPNWHVYWINPGDSGEATAIEWSGLDDLSASAIQWPIPHKIPFGPLTNYGYENQVILLQQLTLPDTLPDGPLALVADISLLVCEDICLPEFHQATLNLNSGQASHPELIEHARLTLPVQQDWAASYSTQGDQVVLEVAYDAALLPLEQMTDVELYFTERGVLNHSASATTMHDSRLWHISQPIGDIPAQEVPISDVVIVFQDPSGQRNGIKLTASHQVARTASQQTSFLYAIGLALLGGIILNVMPCVFPVLALKAMNLAHMHNQTARQAILHGWAYTAGILLSFLIIALLLMVLKSFGAQIGWGFQLQNPVFVMFLIYLLTLVGLNLAGFFEVNSGLTHVGADLANKTGLSGSFYTGVLATLVATPCTAPFMGVAIGYALVQPVYESIAVFLTLGFGLALPYLLLAMFPVTRSWMPRPGEWMIRFKEFLAFPMLATAAWLVWVLSIQADSFGVLAVLMGLVVVTLGIWFLKLNSFIRWTGWAFLLLAMWPFYAVYETQKADGVAVNWQPFSKTSYTAARQNDAALFVNMTAAWCITCQVNEQVALNTDDTKALFAKHNIQYLKGDWTDFDAEITQYLEKYQRNGVPIYVYYGPVDPLTGKRPEPQVLPQILTPAIIKQYVAK
ncbi:protein-disulfide reductase DsbD family protein [Marinicella sediminis]|uniref:Protein-disulfide reductase DsbD family protein n=1 Tax=Marinicella sediminis TaxID=1792834 RepID=A0ABV7JA56_9GAMM|nr:thioredoxin family protein [Marinicella sediminis]